MTALVRVKSGNLRIYTGQRVRNLCAGVDHAPSTELASRNKKPTNSLPANVLDNVTYVVYVDSVKVDARVRARVGDAVENRRHSAAGTTPVRPEVDKGDAIRVGLYEARRDETKGVR